MQPSDDSIYVINDDTDVGAKVVIIQASASYYLSQVLKPSAPKRDASQMICVASENRPGMDITYQATMELVLERFKSTDLVIVCLVEIETIDLEGIIDPCGFNFLKAVLDVIWIKKSLKD